MLLNLILEAFCQVLLHNTSQRTWVQKHHVVFCVAGDADRFVAALPSDNGQQPSTRCFMHVRYFVTAWNKCARKCVCVCVWVFICGNLKPNAMIHTHAGLSTLCWQGSWQTNTEDVLFTRVSNEITAGKGELFKLCVSMHDCFLSVS